MKMAKKRMAYTIVVTLIVVFSSTFAILMTLEREDYKNYIQGEYSKNMYELITSVENIRTNLSKAAIVGSREQSIVVFEEIFRYSTIANSNLNSLYIEPQVTGDTSKFLVQVGDFCYSLARAASQGKNLNEKDYDLIDELEVQSYTLQEQLNEVMNEVNEGKVKWGELRKKSSGVFAKSEEDLVSNKFKGIQKQVVQYPALIYDGPFSDSTLEIKPKVEKEKVVSRQAAIKEIKERLGKEKVASIENGENNGKTRIPSYSFFVTMKGRDKDDPKIALDVTKNGGKIIYLLDGREPSKPSISIKEAEKIGSKFLDKLGYKNMKSTYTLNYKNTAVVSYIYNQDNIAIYPDQIKLKIALDNGTIIGMESEKYLVSHYDNRKIPKATITKENAQKRVGNKLKINKTKLAIVPTESNKEVLCYEFSGEYKNKDFVVYINANTGYEEKIIEIINTPNGKLTI